MKMDFKKHAEEIKSTLYTNGTLYSYGQKEYTLEFF